jgi:protein TonB
VEEIPHQRLHIKLICMMDAINILQADFIDILFDGRNKTYGAYELRRFYNKRLGVAMVAMLAICLSIFIGSVISKENRNRASVAIITDTVQLVNVDPPAAEIPPPPPPVLPEPQPVEMARFTPPVIVEDNQVNEDDLPPAVEVIDAAKIGTMNVDGSADVGIVAPPIETVGTGEALNIATPQEDWEQEFFKVEIEARFPGGPDAWRRYLERNMRYPESAQENGTQGLVKVQFLIDREGNISEVQALNDPGDGMAAEAVRIISNGPKWIPAEQNNRKVKYRQVQAITFRME